MKEERRLKRIEKARKVEMAWYVARHLGVARTNAVLFAAVAKVLGQAWNGQKADGYSLVMEYAKQQSWEVYPSMTPKLVGKKLQMVPAMFERKTDTRASSEFLQSYEWRRLRMLVIKKRGARCECCGASPKDGLTVLNVDHIKPRKLYPDLALDESNLQVLCHACNHGKGNWDQTDWRGTA